MKLKWKTRLKNVSFMILFLKMCLIFGQKKIILIDPGHGGKDTGAIGMYGIQEKKVVFNIAKEIVRLNKMVLNDKFEMYLTRYKDTLISLNDRAYLAKTLNADLFISLHCNASQNNAKGIEVFVHNSDSRFTNEAIELGLAVSNETSGKLGFKTRGLKFANFQVLRETIFNCPSILLEIGFLTNIDEANYLSSVGNIKALAMCVLIGISNYSN
ncbi:N-acetylmuramoyl-L-alanine amidase [Cellulophaga lytica]|uniref:N-acetylmuramoyl-L-alanine amidase family protein n=1 Tax=Cellulophaga lytica TaxID=979 RepID=UPI0032E4CDC8